MTSPRITGNQVPITICSTRETKEESTTNTAAFALLERKRSLHGCMRQMISWHQSSEIQPRLPAPGSRLPAPGSGDWPFWVNSGNIVYNSLWSMCSSPRGTCTDRGDPESGIRIREG